MKRPKVLYLTYEYNNSDGWARCTVNWINGLKEKVRYADILTLKSVPNERAPWNIKPFLLSATNGRLKKILLFLDYINCIVRLQKDYDIVHCLIEPFAPLAHKLAQRYNAKLIIQFVGTYCVQPVNTKWRVLYHEAYKYSNANISISNYTKIRAIEEFSGIDVKVAHIGVDFKMFSLNNYSPKEKYFVFVGASKPRKGLLIALKGFHQFWKDNNEYRFKIIGYFDKKSSYNKQIINYITSNRLPVEFIGFVTDNELHHEFAQCTAHVLPSVSEKFNFEGFGLVHLEANLCGSLTIGSRGSANEEIIKDGHSGFLVDQLDSKQVADAMSKCVTMILHDNNETALNCVKWGQKFPWTISIDAISKHYFMNE